MQNFRKNSFGKLDWTTHYVKIWEFQTEHLQFFSGSLATHPGVGPETQNSTRESHKYYQWVGLLLLLQAWFFYLPRFLWDKWEGGRMRILSAHMEGLHVSESESFNRRNAVVRYLHKSSQRTDWYGYTFLACEMMNFANIFVQILITNAFLGNAFFSYGRNVLGFFDDMIEEKTHPMDKVFPKMSKCVFNVFGPSGNIVPYDTLCVLPLNVLNEKAFLFLWWVIVVSDQKNLTFSVRSRLKFFFCLQGMVHCLVHLYCVRLDWTIFTNCLPILSNMAVKEFIMRA